MSGPYRDCPTCAAQENPEIYWQPTVDGGWHLGARCPACKRWWRWLPQTEDNLQLAPAKPFVPQQGGLL